MFAILVADFSGGLIGKGQRHRQPLRITVIVPDYFFGGVMASFTALAT
jgi:crotonobetainyl-CoA:carnitine CoA-transferase CaiB-like acyl-CoA transferase